MQAKWALARRSFLLLLMWPLTLALGLVDTLQHTLLDEPQDYRARNRATAGLGCNKPGVEVPILLSYTIQAFAEAPNRTPLCSLFQLLKGCITGDVPARVVRRFRKSFS